MSQESQLRKTICCKGHTHPPWNTTGLLRIAKCESVCGFCQEETETAANLRKHVPIHFKNDRLNFTIAEGSSGRGRFEIPAPPSRSLSDSTSTSRIFSLSENETPISSSPDCLPAMLSTAQRPQLSTLDASGSEFSPSATILSMQRSYDRSPESSDPIQYRLRALSHPYSPPHPKLHQQSPLNPGTNPS